MSNLFIPDKIRVGFQNREGTYTGRLAYVIYWDKKGVLRKEKSWQGWRDQGIKPEEFENTPQDGFHLNKDIKRYNWSHFGSNRSYIRIYDSRGIEFEITPENLIGLLTETTCSKRGLDGEFVYAWCGTELVLLPCSAEAYGKAQEYTKLQGQKISARDLKPGCSYTTKKCEEVIYMGRFPWFTWERYRAKSRISKKKHIFAHPVTPQYSNRFFPKNDANFLAVLNNEDAVTNYAELIDEFNGDIHSSIITGWETKPLRINPEQVFARRGENYYDGFKRSVYTQEGRDTVIFWRLIAVNHSYGHGSDHCRGYRLVKMGTLDTRILVYNSERSEDGYYYDTTHDSRPVDTKEQILAKLATFVEVDMVLSSGKKLHLKNIDSIAVD